MEHTAQEVPLDRDGAPVDATRNRVLDAAASLFSERGYAGTSMRAVTRAAGVSVSAANYHFGSKRALLHAVCDRHIGALNLERMAALDEVERQAHPGPPPLEEILRAFLAPVILVRDPGLRHGPREVAARLYADPPEITSELRRELFGPLAQRMSDLLSATLPDADPVRLALAFQFTIGAMVHVAGGNLETALGEEMALPRDARLIDAMVAYCAAGLRAQLQIASHEESG